MVFLRIAGFSLSALVIVARIRNIYHSAQVDAMHRHMRRLRAHLVLNSSCYAVKEPGNLIPA